MPLLVQRKQVNL